MSNSSHSAALNARAQEHLHDDQGTLVQTLLQPVLRLFRRIRAGMEERRLREHLATLPDSLLRDIGVAEHEIHRIRACEQFTPQAWAERMGRSGRLVDY